MDRRYIDSSIITHTVDDSILQYTKLDYWFFIDELLRYDDLGSCVSSV